MIPDDVDMRGMLTCTHLCLVCQYFFVILFFAFLYLDVSMRYEGCHVGLRTIMEAYIFSLETIVRSKKKDGKSCRHGACMVHLLMECLWDALCALRADDDWLWRSDE